MEHLPLPREPIEGHPIIALATKQIDDEGPFLTYKDRHDTLLTGNHPHVPTQADALAGRLTAGVSAEDIIDYYQGWLFFGLLQEFLGDIYSCENYLDIAVGEDEEVESVNLTTRRLHEDLAAWRHEGPLRNMRPGDEYHTHLEECLDMALFAFEDVKATFPGFLEVYADEMLCLASLCETLDSYVTTAAAQGPIDDDTYEMPRSIWPVYGRRQWLDAVASLVDITSDPLKSRMVASGWCLSDIGRVTDAFSRISSFYYFSHFKPWAAAPDDHKDCPFHGCTVQSSAEPKHMSPDCKCPGMVPFEEAALIEIYEHDRIPCFSIGKLEDGSLGIALSSISLDAEAQKDPDQYYVALSHVWSEGMGNPGANSIPFCQLSYVYYWAMLAMQVVEQAEQGERAEEGFERSGDNITISTKPKIRQVNLWIDTVCCPVTPGYGKNLCLAKMRDIYSNAYAVLVRSLALEAMSSEPYIREPEKGVMDLAAQLYFSPWMRRMWTLQEGVLAGLNKSKAGVGDRLVLAYNGGLITLESLVALLKQAPQYEAALAFDMIGKFASLGPKLWNLDSDQDGPWNSEVDPPSYFFLQLLANSLKFRSVSVTSDEIICLATLVGLRIGKSDGIVPLIGDGQTEADGICELWRRVDVMNKGIPGDIIFSSIPRANSKGFRWAPRTFVQHARYGRLCLTASRGKGKIDPNGLVTKFFGAKLTLSNREKYLAYLFEGPNSKVGENVQVHEVAGKVEEQDEAGGSGEQMEEPRNLLIAQIPEHSGEWHAIRIHRPEELHKGTQDAQPAEAPYRNPFDLIKTGSAALIYPSEHLNGPGLLVTIVPNQQPDATFNPEVPLLVRSEHPVTINCMTPSACLIASAVEGFVHRLRASVELKASEDSISTEDVWTDATTLAALLHTTAAEMVAESSDLAEALYMEALVGTASATEERIVANFVRNIRRLVKYIGVGGEVMGERVWCVD